MLREPRFADRWVDDLLKRVAGMPEIRAIAAHPTKDLFAVVVRENGRHQLYVTDRQLRRRVWFGPDSVLVPYDETTPVQFSPSGKLVAYIKEGTPQQVVIREVGTGDRVKLPAVLMPHTHACWGATDDELIIAGSSDGRGPDTVLRVSLHHGVIEILWAEGGHIRELGCSRKGTWMSVLQLSDLTSKDSPMIFLRLSDKEKFELAEMRGRQAKHIAWHSSRDEVAFIADHHDFPQVWKARWINGNWKPELVTDDPTEKDGVFWAHDETLWYTASSQGRRRLFHLSRDQEPLSSASLADGSIHQVVPTENSVYALWSSFGDVPQILRVHDASTARNLSWLDLHLPRVSKIAERVTLPVDELQVHAWYLRPEGSTSFPGVVYLHGGPTSQFRDQWDPLVTYLLYHGYAVLGLDYRGSAGYGRPFEEANDGDWGGGDVDDVVAAAHWLMNRPEIRHRQVAVMGGSYGGYLTLLALMKYPGIFRCGVALYGVTNRVSYWDETDWVGQRGLASEMGLPSERRELFMDRSPVIHLRNLRDPLLILHGEADPRVPVSQSEELVALIRELRPDADVFYRSYPGEGHGFRLPETRYDAWANILGFLNKYLRPAR
ncbi:MAG: alpha/beta fold hydrolase [Clostridiales bacterium]|nr:alpha/beta fold hydrolase [Clostridiales bacterium]